MTYFHVRITVADESHDETRLDLDEASLERVVLTPYRTGVPITINGRTIPLDRVTRLRISASAQSSGQLIAAVKAERANSRVGAIGGPSNEWRAADRASDITDQYIVGPPGISHTAAATSSWGVPTGPGDRRSLFLVVGRDNAAISAIVDFVRSLGIDVVTWDHAVARTGLPNPYVGEVVMTGMRMADATLVLITPDDVVTLRNDLQHDDDGPDERMFMGQARPNVYYEAGIADTLGKERTIIVEVGKVKAFSDVAGRHVVRYDGSSARRNVLVERLKSAGLTVDTTASDWLTKGSVEDAISTAKDVVESYNTRP